MTKPKLSWLELSKQFEGAPWLDGEDLQVPERDPHTVDWLTAITDAESKTSKSHSV